MGYLLDTNVAIHLRERDRGTVERLNALPAPIAISIITQVELEAGVYAVRAEIVTRRAELDGLLQLFPVLPFDGDCARAYGQIVARLAYSRRKVLDRMIAAQALVHGLTLVTYNPGDFNDVPGLELLAW